MDEIEEHMKATDLTVLWCFGEGSIWWRLDQMQVFSPFVEGLQPSVVQNDALNMFVSPGNGKPSVVFFDGTVMRLIELYQDVIATLHTQHGWNTVFELPTREPRDRKSAALRLARLTIDFLVLHELCHIARGHLDHYVPAGALPSLMEFEAPTHTGQIKLDPMTRRLIEVDADICAIFVFGMVAKYMATHVKRYQFPSASSYYDSVRFVLHVLFLLFAGDARNVVSYETAHRPKPHPHPLLRLHILDSYIAKALTTSTAELRTTTRTFKLAAHVLKQVGVKIPDTHYSARHLPFVVDRCNLILDHRADAWPKFVVNSRWNEVVRRVDAIAQ